MSDVITYRWRIGSQVGRTLYIDTGAKHPSNLFGLVDDEVVAAHIVRLHNEWLQRMEESARLRALYPPCSCSCHQTVQPGLVPCPQCQHQEETG